MQLDAARVLATAAEISRWTRRTPLIPVDGGGWIKLESLQPTGSFKVRGFFAAALALDDTQLRQGLVTVSAGNAALACAHVARALGVPCRVLMFDTAPALKVAGVRALGAEVVLMPRAQLLDWMERRSWERGPGTFIHPFADETVMRGHATIAPELLEDCPGLERVFVPVGGGGLACGIAAGLAALKPGIEVVGVQSDGYALWQRAFAANGPVSMVPDTIADGTTAPFEAEMFARLVDAVTSWMVVPEAELRRAVARLATQVKTVAEGAGALAFAAMIDGPRDQGSVAILSGGNIDAARLAELLVS